MSEQSDAEQKRVTSLDFVLPPTSYSLIESLDAMYPQRTPAIEEMESEQGRLKLAKEIGKRELIDFLTAAVGRSH